MLDSGYPVSGLGIDFGAARCFAAAWGLGKSWFVICFHCFDLYCSLYRSSRRDCERQRRRRDAGDARHRIKLRCWLVSFFLRPCFPIIRCGERLLDDGGAGFGNDVRL